MRFRFSLYRPHYAVILRLGWPILVGQLGVIVVGFADTLMVGRYTTEALAAASFVNNLFTLVSLLIMGFSYGLTPLISAHCSRGEHVAAGHTLKNACVSNLLFSALLIGLTGVLYFFLPCMGQPPELLPLIRPYYVIVWSSLLFISLFNVLKQFTDGIMNPSVGMWILLSGNALNILGNYLLIYGKAGLPEMGLMGAGVSTLFSRVWMAVLFVWVLLRASRYACYRRGFFAGRVSWPAVRSIGALSLPVSLQMGMETGSFTFSAVMAGWLGAVSLAAYQVMVTIGTLGFLFYYSIGASLAIRVAACRGAGDALNSRRAAFAGSHILLVWATVTSFMFYVCGAWLIGLFTSDVRVVSTALLLLWPLIMYQYGDAMQICFANALRGVCDTASLMRIAFVSYMLVGIPSGYVLGFVVGWGERGIFLAFSAGLFTAALLFFRRFLRVSRVP